MKLMVLILAALSWGQIASAKLGETMAEVEARYGKPNDTFQDSPAETRTYDYAGYSIIVTFVGGKDICEQFMASKEKAKITEGECLAFAKTISGLTNAEWKLVVNSPDRSWKVWQSGDFRASWSGTMSVDSVTISGKEFTSYAHNARQKKQADSVKNIENAFGSGTKSK